MMKKLYPLVNTLGPAMKLAVSLVVVILYIHYLLPQNWGYFAVKPSPTFYNAYRLHNGIAEHAAVIGNNMSFGMGISRKGRMLYKALVEVVANNKQVTWKPLLKGENSFLLANHLDTIYIDKGTNFFTGTFLITSSVWPAESAIINNKPIEVAQQYILAFIIAK